jgi:hypothetical protein
MPEKQPDEISNLITCEYEKLDCFGPRKSMRPCVSLELPPEVQEIITEQRLDIEYAVASIVAGDSMSFRKGKGDQLRGIAAEVGLATLDGRILMPNDAAGRVGIRIPLSERDRNIYIYRLFRAMKSSQYCSLWPHSMPVRNFIPDFPGRGKPMGYYFLPKEDLSTPVEADLQTYQPPIQELSDEEVFILHRLLDKAIAILPDQAHRQRTILEGLKGANSLNKSVPKEFFVLMSSKSGPRYMDMPALDLALNHMEKCFSARYADIGFEIITDGQNYQAVLTKPVEEYGTSPRITDARNVMNSRADLVTRARLGKRHLQAFTTSTPVDFIIEFLLKNHLLRKRVTANEIVDAANAAGHDTNRSGVLRLIQRIRSSNQMDSDCSFFGFDVDGFDSYMLEVPIDREYIPGVGDYSQVYEGLSSVYPHPQVADFNYSFFRDVLRQHHPSSLNLDYDTGLMFQLVAAYSAANFKITKPILYAEMVVRTDKAYNAESFNSRLYDMKKFVSENLEQHGVFLRGDSFTGYYFETSVPRAEPQDAMTWPEYHKSHQKNPYDALLDSLKGSPNELLGSLLARKADWTEGAHEVPETDRIDSPELRNWIIEEVSEIVNGKTSKGSVPLNGFRTDSLIAILYSSLHNKALVKHEILAAIGIEAPTDANRRNLNNAIAMINNSPFSKISISAARIPHQGKRFQNAYYLKWRDPQ